MRLGISVARPNLVSLGTCFGKFSKSGKFKLHITALDYLAQYAKYKVHVFISLHLSLLSQLCAAGLDKTKRRDAVLVWEPCREGTPGTYHRGHARAPGGGCIQHERHSISECLLSLELMLFSHIASGIRRYRAIHCGYEKTGSYRVHRVPSGVSNFFRTRVYTF